MKKIPNSLKAYLAMFWLGILAGMAARTLICARAIFIIFVSFPLN